ncbi:MAG: hypothetical protein ACKPKO_47580, partial [Candidatus Fonsibacter sp.]
MALKESRLVQIHEHVARNIELTIQDEYDTDKLCGYTEEHKRIIIKRSTAAAAIATPANPWTRGGTRSC